MYSNKLNVLELLALLKHHISSVVLCPGSRNIPLVQSMANDHDFTCYSITDERSAGFFALGLAQQLQQPVAVCCTSGSALLNLYPAVSEAFYQQIPLLVISADRPVAWVGQMDGQTLPQAHVFGSLVKHSVDLPEVKDKQDLWYCNRLINEALLALNFQTPGPVQINVPISEPFFNFEVTSLPQARLIRRFEPHQFNALLASLPVATNPATNITQVNPSSLPSPELVLEKIWHTLLLHFPKIMVIVGQNSFGPHCLQGLSSQEQQLITEHVLLVDENLSNLGLDHSCANIDHTLLLPQVQADLELYPQVLITMGGHIISKRLKHYLRGHQPLMHWHIAPDGAVVDLYHCLSHIVVCQPSTFMQALAQALLHLDASVQSTSAKVTPLAQVEKELQVDQLEKVEKVENNVALIKSTQTTKTSTAATTAVNNTETTAPWRPLPFVQLWMSYSQQVFAPSFAYSQMQAIGQVIASLPPYSVLHLANSSTVRYAQLFKLPQYQGQAQIKVFSNRGVNGIEGSLSAAIGFAAADKERLNFILIGDLSFFYDVNALWNGHISNNVRILLLNNGGGEIFHALPNLHLTDRAQHFVTATHQASAQGWVESQGFSYLAAHDQAALNLSLESFMQALPCTSKESVDKSSVQCGDSLKPMVLEVFTSQEEDTQMLKQYNRQLQDLH